MGAVGHGEWLVLAEPGHAALPVAPAMGALVVEVPQIQFIDDEVVEQIQFIDDEWNLFRLPRLLSGLLVEVVKRKGVAAGSLDGWREMKAFPLPWFDRLADFLVVVGELGVWPEGLLDADIAMIPKVGDDATPLVRRLLGVLLVVYRIWASGRMHQLEDWFRSWVLESVFSAEIDFEEVGAVDHHVRLCVADVVKSFDTVDRGVLDKVLGSLGLLAWFRHAYFENLAHVRLRFKLAASLEGALDA